MDNPRKLVTMTPEMAKRVDEYRWENRIGAESEALRRLIQLGLDSLACAALSTQGERKGEGR